MMNYTQIDPIAVADVFLATQASSAAAAALAAKVNIAMRQFCQEIRIADGKEPDPALERDIEFQTAAKATAEARLADLSGRVTGLDVDAVVTNALVQQIDEWLRGMEVDHVQHGVHLAVALSDEQVLASTMARIEIEGSHAALLTERAALEPSV